MIFKIYLQNVLTGDVWDIATVTKSFTFSTKRSGTPSKLEIELMSEMVFPEGSKLAIVVDDHQLFYGYLFRIRKRKNQQTTLVFFDQRKYLLRSHSYVFKNNTLMDIISKIAKDYGLKVGELKGPSAKLPTILKEDKTALDIIEESIDQVLVQTGELTIFWDDFGELRLDYPKNLAILTILGEGSIVSDFEYESSIEDSANIIKLLHEDVDSGQRTMYITQDSNHIKQWGNLEYFKTVDENLNEAQIKNMGQMLIKMKNRPKRTVKLSLSIGDFDFVAGCSAYINLPEINMKGWYVLESVTHTVSASAHTMELDLWMGDGET